MKITSILLLGCILVPIGKFCEFLGAKNVFLLFEIFFFIGILYCVVNAGMFLMELSKPRHSVPHNNVNDQNAIALDNCSEEENLFSAETKNREFYTRDVVPKNDRKLKINFAALMMYPLKTRMWRLGITNYAEMYRKYPQYITMQEYNELELYRLELDELEPSNNSVANESFCEDDLLNYSLEERMEKLGVDDFNELCKCYPEYVSYEEFQNLLDMGAIRSVDNIIEFKGMYFDNENSEASEWRRFKRFRKNYNERYGEESSNQDLDDFPHDYYQERISDLEDMEYYGSSLSNQELTDAVDDVFDEYSSALEEYNDRGNNY